MGPAMPIFELGRAIPVKKSCVKIWFGLVKPFKSYVHKHFLGGGAETPIRGNCI